MDDEGDPASRFSFGLREAVIVSIVATAIAIAVALANLRG